MSKLNGEVTVCSISDCDTRARMAIFTEVTKEHGLVSTIYQDQAYAVDQKGAIPYCGEHGIALSTELAALCDLRLKPVVVFIK